MSWDDVRAWWRKFVGDFSSTRVQLTYGATAIIFVGLIRGILLIRTMDDFLKWASGTQWYAAMFLGTYLAGGKVGDIVQAAIQRRNGTSVQAGLTVTAVTGTEVKPNA